MGATNCGLLCVAGASRIILTHSSSRSIRLDHRLSALAATVPYYESILNAKADLNKTTVARENDFWEEDRSGLTDFQHGVGKLRR